MNKDICFHVSWIVRYYLFWGEQPILQPRWVYHLVIVGLVGRGVAYCVWNARLLAVFDWQVPNIERWHFVDTANLFCESCHFPYLQACCRKLYSHLESAFVGCRPEGVTSLLWFSRGSKPAARTQASGRNSVTRSRDERGKICGQTGSCSCVLSSSSRENTGPIVVKEKSRVCWPN